MTILITGSTGTIGSAVIEQLVGKDVGDQRMTKGEAATDTGDAMPTIRAETATTLVLFLVDSTASGSRAGTISRQ